MNKYIIPALISLTVLTGCAQVQESFIELEETYEEARQDYRELKPRLDRDFRLLFGTKNNTIHLDAEKVQNNSDTFVPGVQDIVYSRFDTFTENEKARLIKANQKAKNIYKKYQEITESIEEKGPRAKETLEKINEFMKRQEASESGLQILKEFIRIGGEIYLSK